MKTYPIYFNFTESVPGRGFWAGVKLFGQALAVQESPEEWWAYGVNPGAIAGQGATIREAFADLRLAFRRYLADCAMEASTFAEFKAELERFYAESDPETMSEWQEAVRIMKAGGEAPGGMIKQPTESAKTGMVVEELVTPEPISEQIDDDERVAA